MLTNLTTDFALLLVTINPLAIVPVFLGVNQAMTPGERGGTSGLKRDPAGCG